MPLCSITIRVEIGCNSGAVGTACEAQYRQSADTLSTRFDGGHNVGVGLRFLAPQLSRDVFRIDFAFPLDSDSLGEFEWLALFNQAFVAPF